MEEKSIPQTAEQNSGLKQGSIKMSEVVIMGVSAAAPAMCVSGSMGDFMSGAGRAVPLAFAIATVVILLIAANISSLCEKYTNALGTYSFVRCGLGGAAGWWTAWIYLFVIVFTGLPGGIFAQYLQALVPQIPLWLGIIIILVPTTIVLWMGAVMSARLTMLFWIIGTACLIIPAVIAIHRIGADGTLPMSGQLAHGWIPEFGGGGLFTAVLVAIWCYVGFEVPAYMGEELIGGSKAVKKSLPIVGILVGIVYVVCTWLWVIPATEAGRDAMMASPTPLTALIEHIGLGRIQVFCTVAAMLACMTCWFAIATGWQRAIYDMGRTGAMPKFFAKTNKHQSPSTPMLIIVPAYAVISFITAYVNLALTSTLLAMFATIAYLMVAIANMKDRWHEKSAKSVVMNKIVPIITIAVLGYLLITQPKQYLLITGICCLVGLVIIFILRATKGKDFFKKMTM